MSIFDTFFVQSIYCGVYSIWRASQVLLFAGSLLVLSYVVRPRLRQIPLWKIPGPPRVSLLTGNRTQMFHPGAAKFYDELHETYGYVVKTSSFFGDIILLISDPKALNTILLKEQDVFEESDWFLETNRHVLGLGLLSTIGEQHRKQRKMLTPVFSIKHMRSMVPLFYKITHQLQDVLKARIENCPQELDLLDWLGRLALELISQGGLGYTFNSLDPGGEENEFGKAIKECFPTISKLVKFRSIYPFVSRWPSRFLRLMGACLPIPMVHNIMHIKDVMYDNTKKVFDEKKALLKKGDEDFTNQVGEGKDIISILLKANVIASKEERLPDEDILGQMTTLLFAGTDTTSTALSRIFSLLSLHSDVQEKLREELKEAHEAAGCADLNYDDLVALPYLEAVCRETLRLYPPVNMVARVCRADTSVPVSRPIRTSSGTLSSVFIPKGTTLLVNINAVNRDPSIWGADAVEWKPERWLAPLPASVTDAHIPGVYSNTLTFLGGGRSCIGFKFSQLEMKVALSQLITTFRFSPSKEELVWRFGSIVTPSVKGSNSLRPTLPIVIEKA
ncbi:cytochrome P450 [Artomyces pyxidatus]|uniref:Cytochrome P450 n=1 Tax=Artomyces pyxidatus TaxID=48021 RepID=A0ACB8SRX3_9AGAM|nr:cytochrome P450 [Artomyces pyxidatus]